MLYRYFSCVTLTNDIVGLEGVKDEAKVGLDLMRVIQKKLENRQKYGAGNG